MNNIILEYYYRYYKYANYIPSERKFEPYQIDSTLQVKHSGFYSYLGGVLVKLFKLYDSPILLEIADKRYVFENLKVTTRDVERIRDGYKIFQKRHIVIQEGERVIFDTDYDEIEVTFVNDPTPNIDDEDFDFGLYLENTSKRPERQKLMMDNWKM